MPGFSVKMTGPAGGSFEAKGNAPPPPKLPSGPKPPSPQEIQKGMDVSRRKFEDTMKYRKEAVNEGEKIKAAAKLASEVAAWIDNLRFDNAAKMGAAAFVGAYYPVEAAMILATNYKQIVAVMKDPTGKDLTNKLGQAIQQLQGCKSQLERILPALAAAAKPPDLPGGPRV
jgi:hypothetical protein